MSVTSSLSTEVLEGGTIIVTASFQDENGDAATPKTLKYTLKHGGIVVNSKEDISITPGESVSVTLSGDDLPQGEVFFILEGTYDSSAGTDLPLKGRAKITVSDPEY